HGYDFGGMTTLAMRDGKEVRKRTKEMMTWLINGALTRKQLQFPEADSEISDQFATHTYMLANSNIVYSKGNDHIVDAVRCAMLAHEQGQLDAVAEETVCVMPLLTDPIFRIWT
ncbi:MAG: terminase large subunit domain-containing protein, partial [Armatimonadota bacterium]